MSVASVRIDLLAVVELLHEHLTDSLCAEVFRRVRGKERRRLLGLETLARFWTQVVLRAPPSLTHALAEAHRTSVEQPSAYPPLEASDQAFFQRCESLDPEFFRQLLEAFRQRLEQAEPARYAAEHQALAARFGGRIWAVDASSLDPVARRLKVLWGERRVPIPGMVIAFYDLQRGTLAGLRYERELHQQEGPCARRALEDVPAGTLLLGDGLYGQPLFLEAARERGLHVIVRRSRRVLFEVHQRLSSREVDGARVIEEVGDYGLDRRTVTQRARRIRWKRGRQSFEVITDLLDPQQLSAHEALALYRERWGVERLFFELKEVLNLHRFYAANANAVAMQVYASAIVHVALKTAQARIAHALHLEPERLSPHKLFPKIAAASYCLVTAELTYQAVKEANPGVRLKKPDWRKLPFAYARLEEVLLEPRDHSADAPRLKPDRAHLRVLPRPGHRA